MSLLKVFEEHSPKVLSNGQVRMQCPFRENHKGDRAKVSGDGSKSFFATPEINAYHCFSCGAKGSLLKLLTGRFEVPYFEAVELVKFTEYKKEVKDWELTFKWDIEPPKEFIARKFSEETLRKFKIGYDSKKNIVVPLFMNGELKGVKFRKDREFWYSDDFVKVEYLYNYNLKRSQKAGYTILVEGETDTMRVDSFGLDVTGLLGVSLSDFQTELLAKIPNIYLALDADMAGVEAMYKVYWKLYLYTNVEFINFPAKDPEQCTKRQFINAFNNRFDYAEFKYLTTDHE